MATVTQPECYKKELICGKEEHTHTLACYSNPDADVENGDVWQNTVSSVTLTGNWGADLAATAQTQTGYTESTANYAVAEDGQTIHATPATVHGQTTHTGTTGPPSSLTSV